MKHLCSSLPLVAATLLAAGCSSSPGSASRPVYPSSQTGQVLSQEAGLVVAVEEVLIQASSTYPGAPGTGAQVGSAAGRAILTGNPAAVVGAIGGIVGGKAGATMDNKVGDKITIALDSGRTVTIVQPREKQPIMPGERVVIESGSSSVLAGGTTRVLRETPAKDPPYTAKLIARWD